MGIQMEDSNLTQLSHHIMVEEGPDIDDTNDDVQKTPPQSEDGVKSTIDDLKELNLGTLEDPRPIFISALLTPKRSNISHEGWLRSLRSEHKLHDTPRPQEYKVCTDPKKNSSS